LGRDPTNYYYFKQQISSLLYIAVAVFLVWKFPLKILKSHKFALLGLIVAFGLQLLVFSPLGAEHGGAKGWLYIPGLPSIQPSEVFKLAYIFFLSSRLLRKKEIMQTSQFLINFIVLNALLYAIFLFIPDFGTILIIGATALIMVRYAGLSVKKTLSILAIGLFAGALAGLSAGMINEKYNYIQKRFAYFFETDKAAKDAQKEQT
jgi:cell division protein FtsW